MRCNAYKTSVKNLKDGREIALVGRLGIRLIFRWIFRNYETASEFAAIIANTALSCNFEVFNKDLYLMKR